MSPDDTSELRERVLGAAMGLIAANGYTRVTMADVGREAEVAVTDVLACYDSLDDVCAEFYVRATDDLTAGFSDVVAESASLREQVFCLLQAELDIFEPYRPFVKATYVRLLNPLSALGRLAAPVRRRLVCLFDELLIPATRSGGLERTSRWWRSGLIHTAHGWVLTVFAEIDDRDEWLAASDRTAAWLIASLCHRPPAGSEIKP